MKKIHISASAAEKAAAKDDELDERSRARILYLTLGSGTRWDWGQKVVRFSNPDAAKQFKAAFPDYDVK